MMSSSIKNNKHPMLTKFESLVSSGAPKAIKEIGQGVGRGNKELLWREEKGRPHKITSPISRRFNVIDGIVLA